MLSMLCIHCPAAIVNFPHCGANKGDSLSYLVGRRRKFVGLFDLDFRRVLSLSFDKITAVCHQRIGCIYVITMYGRLSNDTEGNAFWPIFQVNA